MLGWRRARERGRGPWWAAVACLLALGCSIETSPLFVEGRDAGRARDGGPGGTDAGPRDAAPADAGRRDTGPPADCVTDAECPPDAEAPWGACGGFDGTCDQTGSQQRTITEHACVAGRCAATTRTETRDCARPTDGTACGTASPGPWGECAGFAHSCDESGTRTRTVTAMVCRGGACSSEATTEAGACTRDTGGDFCTLPGDCAGRCALGSCVVACIDCRSVCPSSCDASCESVGGFASCCKCSNCT